MFAWLRDKVPWEIILQLAVWILAAMILGLYDFYTFRFDIYRVLRPDYLIEVGTLVGLGILIFIMRLVQKSRDIKEADEPNQELLNTMNGYVNSDNKLTKIVKFITLTNVDRRITAYKEKTQKRVGRLLAKLNDKQAKQYAGDAPVKSWRVKKLQRLVKSLEPEYIMRYKEYLPVKFVRLSPSFMTSGFNSGSDSENDNPAKPFMTALKDNALNFAIPTLFVAFIIASFLIENDVDRWAVVLMVSIKLVLLGFQHWSAGRYAPTFVGKTWIHDLHLRKRLWEEYFQWVINTKGGEANG